MARRLSREAIINLEGGDTFNTSSFDELFSMNHFDSTGLDKFKILIVA